MSISTKFRPLNENETQAINHAYAKGKLYQEGHPLFLYLQQSRVSYERMQGGFCVCVIVIDDVPVPVDNTRKVRLVYRGASRRSYKDPRKPIRGEMLAFSRAILYSRPVELS